jgi:hypothetical protein
MDIFHGTVLPQLDLLGFKGFDKTHNIGIIIGIASSTHADLEVIVRRLFDILMQGVLDTTV